MDDCSSSRLLHKDDHLTSLRTRNKFLILTFFSLIILLTLIIGGIIVSLVHKINSQSSHSNPALQLFCAPSESQSYCISLLSSQIKPLSNTTPNRIFLLSLESSLQKLSSISFGNCSSSLSHAASQLTGMLEILPVDPDVESYERGMLTAWIEAAAEDLTACVRDLEKSDSAEMWKKVFVVREVVVYSRDFLINCEMVNDNFRFVNGGERNSWDMILENLAT